MDFDIGRLRRAEQLIGGGAVALFVFLFFFKWYGVSTNLTSISGVNINVSRTGWETFTNSRWIWLLTIIVALAAVALVAMRRTIELPVSPGAVVTGLGALSTLFILYRIVHHPTASASVGSFHASAGIKLGIWLGLLAAVAITYGGLLSMQHAAPATEAHESSGQAFTGLTVNPATAEPAPAGEPSTTAAPPIPEPPAPASEGGAPPAPAAGT
ncbi:MAG TPA: hypothetical protein VGO14_01425 [Solirubrobacteraceae bacterium]|nr:hypothetical protein [Solirubrobacteraceae bacterium]